MVSEVGIAAMDVLRHHFPGLLAVIDQQSYIAVGAYILGVAKGIEYYTDANKLLLGSMQVARLIGRLLRDPQSNAITKEVLALPRYSKFEYTIERGNTKCGARPQGALLALSDNCQEHDGQNLEYYITCRSGVSLAKLEFTTACPEVLQNPTVLLFRISLIYGKVFIKHAPLTGIIHVIERGFKRVLLQF